MAPPADQTQREPHSSNDSACIIVHCGGQNRASYVGEASRDCPQTGGQHPLSTPSNTISLSSSDKATHDLGEAVAVGSFVDAAVGQLYSCRGHGGILRVDQEGVHPLPATTWGRKMRDQLLAMDDFDWNSSKRGLVLLRCPPKHGRHRRTGATQTLSP